MTPRRPYGGDPDDEPSDNDGFPGNKNRKEGPRSKSPRGTSSPYSHFDSRELHFDLKLKTTDIPTWDGNPGTLTRWILKVNTLASRGRTVYTQLGQLVPARLEKDAEQWFWSLPIKYHQNITESWKTF
ncbi:hypothetical protein M422DRAFT_189533 [Sphaerobolus stellatus SS14]|uniref:Uncharacterized protein n=1 Tax=Sphaerobolus stellatus (strain SS14) TaxID=990650 RepID=A0A0C9UTT9_SPHS4|nr:hypothetical protein M422DRAFT_189533 [Sphaerobolus stellatus SS14]